MSSSQDAMEHSVDSNTLDLIQILKRLYVDRKRLIFWTVISFIASLFIAINSPISFTASTTFVPQSGTSRPSSSLTGLASLAGINLGAVGGNSEFPPTLFPQILNSTSFKLSLLDTHILVNDEEMNLREYYKLNSKLSFIALVKKYILGIPSLLTSLFQRETNNEINLKSGDLYEITEEDRSLFELLNSNLEISINQLEGFVTLKFTDSNRYVTATVAQAATDLLQTYITEFKNNSAKELLQFATKQYKESKISYELLQDSIAIFKDSNLNISSALFQNKVDRLDTDLQISKVVIEQLASQVEQAKLQVNIDTPVFTVIDPVTIPFYKSSPRKSFVFILWFLFGFVLASLIILIKEPFEKIVLELKE